MSQQSIKETLFHQCPHTMKASFNHDLVRILAYIGNEIARHQQSLVISLGFTDIVDESKVVTSELNFAEVTRFVVNVGSDFPEAHESMALLR